jgi:hypothetical protein
MAQAVSGIGSRLLQLDGTEFREKFPNLGFKAPHDLCDCPLFELSRLVQLAQSLPAEQVEYFAGQVPVNQDAAKHPKNGLSIVETVRRIEHCGSWMVLKNVEADPEYGQLLRDVLDGVYRQLGSRVTGIRREEAFIFISSPNAVTPYHLDEEHNFLLQIRGSKEVSMWNPRDRATMPEEQAEKMLQIWHVKGYHRNMTFHDEFQRRATVFALRAGEALHFPVGAPHWVKNGPEVSISFSVTFRSEMSERQAIVYFVNGSLRRLGLTPTPPGQSPWRDSVKVGAFRMAHTPIKTLQNAISARRRQLK